MSLELIYSLLNNRPFYNNFVVCFVTMLNKLNQSLFFYHFYFIIVLPVFSNL